MSGDRGRIEDLDESAVLRMERRRMSRDADIRFIGRHPAPVQFDVTMEAVLLSLVNEMPAAERYEFAERLACKLMEIAEKAKKESSG